MSQKSILGEKKCCFENLYHLLSYKYFRKAKKKCRTQLTFCSVVPTTAFLTQIPWPCSAKRGFENGSKFLKPICTNLNSLTYFVVISICSNNTHTHQLEKSLLIRSHLKTFKVPITSLHFILDILLPKAA